MRQGPELRNLLESGVHRMGELEIRFDSNRISVFHWQDSETAALPASGGLEIHQGPGSARKISTFSADGSYRFGKAEVSLKRGWVMHLSSFEDLRSALDQFYPAAIGLFLALKDGTLETENLRDKLNRQTGMYRFARNISDSSAQALVKSVCGPANRCARRILWQLDANTPLEDSAANQYNGIPGSIPESQAIPLLCREACNHFVSECRRKAKEESATSNRLV